MKIRIRAACILLAVIAGCSPPGNAKKPADTGVGIDAPKKKTLRRVIEQPAFIEAYEETPLVARIPGYVEKVNVDIGKSVKQGEVLAEIAVPELLREFEEKQARVKLAKADTEQAEATLEAAESHILTANAQVKEAESARARAVAEVDLTHSIYVRMEDLVKTRSVEVQVRDESLNKYKSAEATRQEVEAKVQSTQAMAKESVAQRDKSKADVSAAKARMEVARAEESRLASLVDFRFIRAPFDGMVTRRNVHTGHFLQPALQAGLGAPSVLFVVARTDKLRIVAELPEADSIHIADDATASIQLPIMKEQPFTGKVTRTSWTLDAKARTLRIEIDYPNQDRKLRPGMYANLSFTAEFPDRWTLPASAIFTHVDQPSCWRVVAGKAVRTPLKLGMREGQSVEVLKMQTRVGEWDAPSADMEVVVSNLGAVSEGKEVVRRAKE
jgi:HlyD family secretion protein